MPERERDRASVCVCVYVCEREIVCVREREAQLALSNLVREIHGLQVLPERERKTETVPDVEIDR